jgi:hypothetical protein
MRTWKRRGNGRKRKKRLLLVKVSLFATEIAPPSPQPPQYSGVDLLHQGSKMFTMALDDLATAEA